MSWGFFLYISHMKNFILGLVLMFTLSVLNSSIGFATPVDAEIEKTFEFEKQNVDALVFHYEIVKVAVHPVMYDMVEKRIKKPFYTLHGFDFNNKKTYSNLDAEPYNLPLKVGWC